MIETKRYCYCDVLSEHNGNRVPGATTYKDMIVMKVDDEGNEYTSRASIDLCPSCYAKYRTNLVLNFDQRGRTSYSFVGETDTEEPTAG